MVNGARPVERRSDGNGEIFDMLLVNETIIRTCILSSIRTVIANAARQSPDQNPDAIQEITLLRSTQ